MLTKADIRGYSKKMKEIETIKKPMAKILELAKLLIEAETKAARRGG